MGAWIEIFLKISKKLFLVKVAPFMGAWIEISCKGPPSPVSWYVAPFMGAWIEIFDFYLYISFFWSRTLYGCVDWNMIKSNWSRIKSRRTLYGCVDWNSRRIKKRIRKPSRTLYGCVDWNACQFLSLPTSRQVAPFMGAWIEIGSYWYVYEGIDSRTLYGCVDWNHVIGIVDVKAYMSHPLWVRGLKFKILRHQKS